MSKKLIYPFIILTVVVISAIIYLAKFPEKNVSPLLEKKAIPTSIAKKLKEYIDPSGFKFKYPDDLKFEAKDITSSSTLYANIIITSTSRKGQIILKAEDATKTFFDEGLKEKVTIETKLDDVNAFQYQEKNKLITTAYDQGVSFTFTTDFADQKIFWFDVNKQILNSFEFAPPETSSQSTESSEAPQEEIFFEGEEIIE